MSFLRARVAESADRVREGNANLWTNFHGGHLYEATMFGDYRIGNRG